MTLYHFCAAKHIKSILRHGLDQGGLTEIKPTGFVVHGGWTWLTTDPILRIKAGRQVTLYSTAARHGGSRLKFQTRNTADYMIGSA